MTYTLSLPRLAVGVVCLYLAALFTSLASGASDPTLETRYSIQAELLSQEKVVQGEILLELKNSTSSPVENLLFHLYLNAFRDNYSTWSRENDYAPMWDRDGEIPDDYWGFSEVESLTLVNQAGTEQNKDLATFFIQPDDGNLHDRTVLQANLESPLQPGEALELKLLFRSKLPRGIARTGWVDDYFFVTQWFPKLGVFQNGTWNCHQYHRSTEYFASFSDYDVRITVPSDFVLGATGDAKSKENPDGTTTYHVQQSQVHDFVWTASPRFNRHQREFSYPSGKSVQVTLLLLGEHGNMESRYFDATFHTLHYMGEWFGEYPYPTLTVVDPPANSSTGGMEYPTLFTGGTHFLSPPESLSPEGVTIHEAGHQWWYGLVANNEFEEAWLDEGINSWAESRVQRFAYPGQKFYVRTFFGGIPLVFRATPIPLETASLGSVRHSGNLARMTEPSWELIDGASYGVNSYSKPEMVLNTLERLLGEEVMLKAMRAYFKRYSFKHPTTTDFTRTIEESSGRDLTWFFDQTFESSDLVDYAITRVESEEIPHLEGHNRIRTDEGDSTYRTDVVVTRLQAARLPVDVLFHFEDGSERLLSWDGQDRRHSFSWMGSERLAYAVVDPERKILLDIDPINNSRRTKPESGYSLATWKWASKWLFSLQNLMETFAFLG
jgi:hypothetical protein